MRQRDLESSYDSDPHGLLFGPGAIEVAHKPNEFTPKDEFHRAGDVLRALIARFCS